MKTNNLNLTILLVFSLIIISCRSSKQIFEYGSVKPTSSVETIKISNINNLPLCKVQIDGKEYVFLVDTGAPTIIPPTIFHSLNLKSYFEEEVTDTNNGKRKQIFTILPEIKIGNLTFQNIGCVVMDIENPTLKCFGFDGIIGANLLAKMVWQFDYKKNEIRASSEFKYFNQKYDYVIPFEYNNQKTPKINGIVSNKKLTFSLDTGYNGSLSINNNFQYSMNNTPKENFVRNRGANAIGFYGTDEFKDNFILRSDLQLNNFHFINKIVKSGNSTLIGNDFLKNFLFSIEKKKKKIYLQTINSEIESLKSFGFSYTFKNNEAYVISKFANQEIPLELNDRILKINNIDLSKLSNEQICQYTINKIDENLNDMEITILRNNKIFTYKLVKKEFIK